LIIVLSFCCMNCSKKEEYSRVSRRIIDNHVYIEICSETYGNYYVSSICHDPDCPCHKAEK
jgi:hypothetical protein